MDKKYTIFISSTYDDLKDERRAVVQTILEMGHIPVGMEMFSAANEEQWRMIQRSIDQSDYYLVIVANRYGSMAGDVSYTEKEYNYASKTGTPIIGFVLKDAAAWPSSRGETKAAKRKLLDHFKEKVKSKPVGFWETQEDLRIQVAIALMKIFNTEPRPGWVRGTDAATPETANEVARLSKENSEFRQQIQSLQATPNPRLEFEIAWASLQYQMVKPPRGRLISEPRWRWVVNIVVLVTPPNGTAVQIPKHRVQIQLQAANQTMQVEEFSFIGKEELVSTSVVHAVFRGPGAFRIASSNGIAPVAFRNSERINLSGRFRPSGIDQEFLIEAVLQKENGAEEERWMFRNSGYSAVDPPYVEAPPQTITFEGVA